MALYDAAPTIVQDSEGNPVEIPAGTLLARTDFGADQHSLGEHPQYKGNNLTFMFDAGDLPALKFGHRYIISIYNNDDSMGDLSWDRLMVDDSDIAEAWPGGDYVHFAYKTDGESNWNFSLNQRPLVDFIIREWGAPGQGVEGAHLKFTPKWNDNVFVQHADDQINNTPEQASTSEPHESYGVPIGEAIESYSGYLTVEVWSNPDTDFSEDFLITPETNIEEVKVINLEPWEDGVYELVFRLRTARGSEYYEEVVRYLQVIT
jgi:hypothetical protein